MTDGANTVAARATTYPYDRKGRVKTETVDPRRWLQLTTNYSYDHLDNTSRSRAARSPARIST